MPRLADVILRGTRALQPAANAVAEGALYYVTDENKTERSNGSSWDAFTDASGAATDHGLLTGLADDDHTQYLLASEAGGRTTFDTNWTDLTDGGATALHTHSGGSYDSTIPSSQSDFIDASDTNESVIDLIQSGDENIKLVEGTNAGIQITSPWNDFVDASDTHEDVTDLIQAGSNITITELGTRGAISIASSGGGGATETRRIPIQIRSPQTASNSGNSFFNIQALTNQDFGCWEFVKDVVGNVFGVVGVPPEASSPSASIILIIAANATSGVTTLNVSTKCVAEDGETVNVSFTADTQQDITVPATAYLTKKVTFTAGDLGNAAANDLIFVQIQHVGTAANDTLAVNTLLIDAYLEVNVTPA